MMFSFKSCIAAFSWIASSMHLHPRKPKPPSYLETELSKALTEGIEASSFAQMIQSHAEQSPILQKQNEAWQKPGMN